MDNLDNELNVTDQWKRSLELNSIRRQSSNTATISIVNTECDHDLQLYIGFREIYQFCRKCGYKGQGS